MLLGEQYNVLLHQLPVLCLKGELNSALQNASARGKIRGLERSYISVSTGG